MVQKKPNTVTNNENRTVRNSNLELLRIISMIFVVASHYSLYGFDQVERFYSGNKYLLDSFYVGSLGVTVFMLISGYFMFDSSFTLKKFLRLAGEMYFYSVAILLVYKLALEPDEPLGLIAVVRSLSPVLHSGYWFMTAYLILMLLTPWLNRFIRGIPRDAHLKLIIFLVVLWGILPQFTLASTYYNDLEWLITLYFIAAYIRRYHEAKERRAGRYLWLTMGTGFLMIISEACFNLLGKYTGIEVLLANSTYFTKLNSILTLGTGVWLFLYFCDRKPFYSKAVNAIATATLGVYLIHHNHLLRYYLWQKIFHSAQYYQSGLLLVHAFVAISGVYLVCTLIDFVRIRTVEKAWMTLVDRKLVPVFVGGGQKICRPDIQNYRLYCQENFLAGLSFWKNRNSFVCSLAWRHDLFVPLAQAAERRLYAVGSHSCLV